MGTQEKRGRAARVVIAAKVAVHDARVLPIIRGARDEGVSLRRLSFLLDLYELPPGRRGKWRRGKWSRTAVRRIMHRHGIE